MALSKTASGWHIDIQPNGRGGKRYRKTLPTKAEALAWETWVKGQIQQTPEWSPAKKDSRRLLELVNLWHAHHGVGLRAGDNTVSRLRLLCEGLGNPVASQLRPEHFAEYRATRLNAGISANAVNREHAYLRAVFNELERLGHWKDGNPLAKVRQMKVPERELSFLTLDQMKALLDKLSGDAHLIAKVCLATGARWGEAEGLKINQLRGDALHFSETKAGKNRSVPVSADLAAELNKHLFARYGNSVQLAERFFVSGYTEFRKTVETSGLVLPRGQLTHVLRHTFASHFMMNGGNILVLQHILGHASLSMTMRYAHLAPDHLQEARLLNPLTRMDKIDNQKTG